MVLDKASILAAPDLKREVVDVPEWGEGAQVIVSEMSGLDRLEYGQVIESEEYSGKLYFALALVFMIVDESGKRVFSKEDIDNLSGKNSEVLKRIYGVGAKLNIIGPALGEEVKNSEASQEG